VREQSRPGEAPTIVHVFPSFARGGQQMRLATVARGLGDRFRHRVISLDNEVSAKGAFDPQTIEVETFAAKKSAGLSLSNIRGLARLIDGGDLLCTYNFGSLEAALANRRGPKLPHLHFEDGFGPDESLTRQKLRRVLLRRFLLADSLVIVPSRGLEELALGKWRLKRANLRRIVNGVEIARFGRERGPRNAAAPVIVGSVGALRPEKNYLRLIGAFTRAAPGKAAKLTIYGEGQQRARLGVLAGKAGCDIELRGETSAPEKAYASFDIFALSSDTEQAPLSLMEAMAAGLPVVATDVGDIRDMVAEENRAFITPLGDDDALADALALLIGDSGLRARLGAANAGKARASFSAARMVEDFRALFTETLERGR
jgi:glycosyltransferase involved in cell wall biosynthesis